MAWQTDYQAAVVDAASRGKLLAVFFFARGDEAGINAVAAGVLAGDAVRMPLTDMDRVQVPLTATLRVGNEDVVVHKHTAFRGLEGRPGLAILDLRDGKSPTYGTVITSSALRPKIGWDAAAAASLAAALRKAASPVHAAPDRGVVATGATTILNATVDAARIAPAIHVEPASPRMTGGATPAPKPDTATSLVGANVRLPALPGLPPQTGAPIAWENDYAKALEHATQRRAMLVLFFPSAAEPRLGAQFEHDVLEQPEVRGLLQQCVCAKLPLDATIKVNGKDTQLLAHDSFQEMLHQPGLAMVDVRHKDSKWFGQVVSVFPFLDGQPYTVGQTLAMLRLPEGSLTQRTMIYAVAAHPEHPASITGRVDANLLDEAQSHSEHQARIQRQGHHDWSTRFHRINEALGDGMLSREVCAESWPGQTLVESAIECVRCWRLSTGHWGAVSGQQDAYGYDIKRGENGIWYATGIFGHR